MLALFKSLIKRLCGVPVRARDVKIGYGDIVIVIVYAVFPGYALRVSL